MKPRHRLTSILFAMACCHYYFQQQDPVLQVHAFYFPELMLPPCCHQQMHNKKKKSPRLDHNNNLIIQTRKEKIKPFQQRQWRMQRGVCVGRGGGMNTRTDTGGTGGTGRTKQNIQMRLTGSNNNNSHHSHASVSPPLDLLEAPSIKTIIYFAIPAIGIWLCGPLLSLIDTSAVGLLSGTAQQAALNPAITITEDGALLVSFMYTATTNLVAAAVQNDRTSKDKSLTINTVITSLKLAIFVGLLFGFGLGALATPLNKALMGRKKEIDLDILSAAVKYVRIRALGMPAAVVIGSAQSACLGMKDIKSPLIVMVAAAFVNLIGDILFVPNQHPLLGGAAGAAWATVFSQYAAMIMFLKWLKSKPADGIIKSKKKYASTNKHEEHKMSFSTRGILHDHFNYRDLLQLPTSYVNAKKFLPYVIPVTATALGRVSGYIAMAHVVSSALSTTELAAQQIVLAFFLCFIPMCDSLNLTAQSFVPSIFEYKGNTTLRSNVMKQTTQNFLKAGGMFGFVLMAIVSCIPLVSKFFSHDLNVIASVNATTVYISLYALLSGIVCSGEGLLLGQKDLTFLSGSFTAFFFVVPYLLLRLKHAVLSGVQGIGLATVWRVFTMYQSVRCILWLVRIKYLSSRLEIDEGGR